MTIDPSRHVSKQRAWLAALALGAALMVFAALFLAVEAQWKVFGLLALAIALAWIAARVGRIGLWQRIARAHAAHETPFTLSAILMMVVLAGVLYDNHFALLMIATVLVYSVACLGLNIQFGYVGVVNFAGAAFFGIGGYTAALLTQHSALPHPLILLLGGAFAALIGSLLLLPVLRTRGHYAALVTIAFGILFKTFLEVNDALGGPQGLKVKGLNIFGWAFNDNIELGETEISFYVNYVALALALVAAAFALSRRLERSWVGLNWDAVRIDETAAATFGINVLRWKITAFTLGNFLLGIAGSVYAMMLGFIAPNNFTLADSLIMISIIVLGGLGSVWGVALGAAIVLLLPEKLQILEEYRFLLFALLVIAMLLFRPQGLIPRGLRRYPMRTGNLSAR